MTNRDVIDLLTLGVDSVNEKMMILARIVQRIKFYCDVNPNEAKRMARFRRFLQKEMVRMVANVK